MMLRVVDVLGRPVDRRTFSRSRAPLIAEDYGASLGLDRFTFRDEPDGTFTAIGWGGTSRFTFARVMAAEERVDR